MFETHRAHTLVPSCQQRANRTTPEKRSWENKIKVNLFPTSFLENCSRCAPRCLLHSIRSFAKKVYMWVRWCGYFGLKAIRTLPRCVFAIDTVVPCRLLPVVAERCRHTPAHVFRIVCSRCIFHMARRQARFPCMQKFRMEKWARDERKKRKMCKEEKDDRKSSIKKHERRILFVQRACQHFLCVGRRNIGTDGILVSEWCCVLVRFLVVSASDLFY